MTAPPDLPYAGLTPDVLTAVNGDPTPLDDETIKKLVQSGKYWFDCLSNGSEPQLIKIARWAAEACRHHAAYRGARRKVRRLESQTLVLFGQRGFHFGQRSPGAGGNHQFAGFVAGDASVAAGVQRFGVGGMDGTGQRTFAAPAADAQARAAGACGAYLVH